MPKKQESNNKRRIYIMNDFIKIKANARSLSHRNLVHGHGTNDVSFMVYSTVNGKQVMYKPYRIWTHMLERCFSAKLHEKFPTYRGCTVCEEWLIFSNFDSWMNEQDWQGRELDKDILFQSNKLYSPATCCFISKSLNLLLNAHGAARGDLPLGVDWHKARKKYRAKICINGKNKYLGLFKTPEAAKAVYNKAKYAEIHRHAMMQSDPAIREGLLNWVIE